MPDQCQVVLLLFFYTVLTVPPSLSSSVSLLISIFTFLRLSTCAFDQANPYYQKQQECFDPHNIYLLTIAGGSITSHTFLADPQARLSGDEIILIPTTTTVAKWATPSSRVVVEKSQLFGSAQSSVHRGHAQRRDRRRFWKHQEKQGETQHCSVSVLCQYYLEFM